MCVICSLPLHSVSVCVRNKSIEHVYCIFILTGSVILKANSLNSNHEMFSHATRRSPSGHGLPIVDLKRVTEESLQPSWIRVKVLCINCRFSDCTVVVISSWLFCN